MANLLTLPIASDGPGLARSAVVVLIALALVGTFAPFFQLFAPDE
jgi:hypothetical protein